MLAAISDQRIQKKIFERVRDLSSEPEKQGKPLVLIVALGIRKADSKKDVYDLAKRLVQLGLVEPK